MKGVLSVVHRHFPKVKKVEDAIKPIMIEVTKSDDQNSKRKDHEQCAMAVACKRAFNADGVIISRSVAYLIKGTTAIRYVLPPSVTREIVSFDRGSGFSPGMYQLSVPSPSNTLGARQEEYKHRKEGGSTGPSRNIRKYHLTTGIRTVLTRDTED